MALKSYSTIVDEIQDNLGSNTTDFTDTLMLKWVPQGLDDFSRYCPHIIRETFATTEDSKELDISEIKDLMWIQALEFRVDKTVRQWRNFKQHYGSHISMDIDFWPADTDSEIDTDEAMDSSETGMDCDADATTAIPAGTIIRVENELMYVTATGTSLTVVRGYSRSTATTHITNTDIEIPELAYLYCAKVHKLPVVADIAGAATADYTASVLTINADGFTTTGTLEAGSTFTIASDGTTTHYTLLKDTVLSGGAGDLVFTPCLAEAVATSDVVTFDNSTLTMAQETLFIDYMTARCALAIAPKFIQGIPQSGRNPFQDYMTLWQTTMAVALRKLEEEAKKYQKPYTEWPISYDSSTTTVN